mgnify:CR=1 FL=1
MGKLFLIRHAKTKVDPNVDSKLWKLEPSAQTACHTLAEKLEVEGLNRIVTSEEFKAEETGRLIAEPLSISCQSAPNLHEHERTGVPFLGEEAWLKTVTSFFENQDELVFGTETATQARERFDRAVRSVLKRYSNETLAICSHGTVMSLFIAHYNPVDVLEFWQTLKMPDVVALSGKTFELTEY